jgi:uncharacterized protein
MTHNSPNIAARFMVGIFRFWQVTFSAVLMPSCRFTPSCSAYGIEAVQKHGALKGVWLTFKRLGRCHPIKFLGAGDGYDPVPPAKSCDHERPSVLKEIL